MGRNIGLVTRHIYGREKLGSWKTKAAFFFTKDSIKTCLFYGCPGNSFWVENLARREKEVNGLGANVHVQSGGGIDGDYKIGHGKKETMLFVQSHLQCH